MKLSCDWLVLCEQVIADQHTKLLTLVNCLEQVSALSFPSIHPRFAFAATYSRSGASPASGVDVAYRLVRYSDTDDEDEIVTLTGTWSPESARGRVFVNFGHLRLHRAERVYFRLDHRVGRGRWHMGMTAFVEVVPLQLTEQQLDELNHHLGRDAARIVERGTE